MLLAVPVFAIIYMLFKEFLEGRLRKKSMPEDSLVYERGDTGKYTNEYVYTDSEKRSDEEWMESRKPKKKKLEAAIEKLEKEKKEKEEKEHNKEQ
jgi:hypothetical protein